jgi:hypothetical protein
LNGSILYRGKEWSPSQASMCDPAIDAAWRPGIESRCVAGTFTVSAPGGVGRVAFAPLKSAAATLDSAGARKARRVATSTFYPSVKY